MHDEPRCTPGLRLYQTLMEKDRRQRLGNQVRLRELAQGHREITIFCAHDGRELERLSGRPSHHPAQPLTVAPATTAG
jgi:hypothetical protein